MLFGQSNGNVDGVNELIGYGIPLAVLGLSCFLALKAHSQTQSSLQQVFEISRNARFYFSIVATSVVLLVLGALLDKVDISEIFDGNITYNQTALLSLTSISFGFLLYLQRCWWDWEEHLTSEVAKNQGTNNELSCQRNFLVALLSHVHALIGKYTEFVFKYLSSGDFLNPDKDEETFSAKIYDLLLTAMNTYKSIPTIGLDGKIYGVIFRPMDGHLAPYASYDGHSCGFFNEEYLENREQFKLRGYEAHMAVKAYFTDIQIWSQGPQENERSREQVIHTSFTDAMKSAVAIPLDIKTIRLKEDAGISSGVGFDPPSNERGNRWVLWLWCDQPSGFIVKHKWKAEQIRAVLSGRISLLSAHRFLLNVARALAQMERDQPGESPSHAHKYPKETTSPYSKLDKTTNPDAVPNEKSAITPNSDSSANNSEHAGGAATGEESTQLPATGTSTGQQTELVNTELDPTKIQTGNTHLDGGNGTVTESRAPAIAGSTLLDSSDGQIDGAVGEPPTDNSGTSVKPKPR